MSEKELLSGEKSPILPKYYKADMDESTPSRANVSFKTSGGTCCRLRWRTLVALLLGTFILFVVIALAVGLGTYYGTKNATSNAKSNPFNLTDSISKDDLRILAIDLSDTQVDNSRSVLTGYNTSAEFVYTTLVEHGYYPTREYFTVPVPEEKEGTFKVSFDGKVIDLPQYNQFQIMIYSAGCQEANNDECTWELASVINDEESNYGCSTIRPEIAEGKALMITYAPYARDGIVIDCSIYEKAYNAKQAGAAAVIFVSADPNSISVPRTRVFKRNDDGTVSYVDIPSVGVNNATGNQLIALNNSHDDLQITLELSAGVTEAVTYNVFAETEDGNDDSVIIFGSHLDSVPAGPGINDDGSGSMLNLLIAMQMSKLDIKPKNKVRFAFWGAEELGLLGSRYYVSQLNDSQKQDIGVYLNFDMVGSPNYIRGIYSAASAMNDDLLEPLQKIQNLFEEYFNTIGVNHKLVNFTGGSDYRPFLDAGIPAGGLFTGAGDIKTEDEWFDFGGIINVAYDPCYHQLCDTINNIDYDVYEEMSKAASYTLEVLMEQDDLDEYLYG